MKKIWKRLAVGMIALLGLFQIACSSDDAANAQCDRAICTLLVIVINVGVTDANLNPVALDSYQVVNLASGIDVTLELTPEEFEEAQQKGVYPLTADGVFGVNQERQIQFRGFLNNSEVIRSNYTVATDCCHVSLISGITDIILP